MDARDFFEAIIKNMPSRGFDYVEVYVHEETEEDPICYEIIDISNDGSNDGLYITIKKV